MLLAAGLKPPPSRGPPESFWCIVAAACH